MKNKADKTKEPWKIPLLPSWGKLLGLAVLFLPIVIVVVFKWAQPSAFLENKETWKHILANIALMGLFIFACTREKQEDEMMAAYRLKAMAVAFCWGTMLTLLDPITDFIFRDPFVDGKVHYLVFQMLFFYLVVFYSLKKWAGEKHG